jgi:hypothetical protein
MPPPPAVKMALPRTGDGVECPGAPDHAAEQPRAIASFTMAIWCQPGQSERVAVGKRR